MQHCAPAYVAILALSIVAEILEKVLVVVAVGEEDGEECNNNDDNDDTYHHHFMPYSIAGRQAQQNKLMSY